LINVSLSIQLELKYIFFLRVIKGKIIFNTKLIYVNILTCNVYREVIWIIILNLVLRLTL